MQRRVLLIIMDGWGLAPAGPTNAISVARTPNFDSLWSQNPHFRLNASGSAVGLPGGQMGNSEVGHMTIGSGRIPLQDLPRITAAIKDGSFFHNQVILDAFKVAKENKKKVHLVGLLGDGGVHAHESHLFALLEMAKHNAIHDVYVHGFTDGRDTDTHSGITSVGRLENEMKKIGVGKIATICGRYYAMDRDHRWERTELAYRALVAGEGELADTASDAVNDSYRLGISDEFIKPTVVCSDGIIGSGDVVIFFNFRSDRPRQLVRAIFDSKFTQFKRQIVAKDVHLVTLTVYEKDLPVSGVAFPFTKLPNTLSDVVSEHGLTQYHLAETEKYAHVTYFFEGGSESQEVGEDRTMVPSPKVATYDEKPQMSAEKVGDELLERLGKYDFIVVNFANPDMVGHTGKLKAAIKAVETVDKEVGEVVAKASELGYVVLLAADHGNAEKMAEPNGKPCTTHTTSPVPLVIISGTMLDIAHVTNPGLSNIAPTILKLMKLPVPHDMTSKSLVK